MRNLTHNDCKKWLSSGLKCHKVLSIHTEKHSQFDRSDHVVTVMHF